MEIQQVMQNKNLTEALKTGKKRSYFTLFHRKRLREGLVAPGQTLLDSPEEKDPGRDEIQGRPARISLPSRWTRSQFGRPWV